MKRLILAVASLAALAAAVESSDRYLWPLDAERKLSSSFAEYRQGHYHAGIDLRTFGQVGLPCRAIDDCEAVRLRVQPSGYGKALYLRAKDGRIAVYAHLDGFCRSLDSLAYHWRLERQRNSCDIDIQAGMFAFRRGDIVAYTGSTGSLHPHLHFEMREANGRPLNPLERFFEVPDTCPPILMGLAVIPQQWGSLVDGSPLARTVRFSLLADNRYAVADTFVLEGEFGFGVRAYDKQTLGSYRMGWYEAELRIDSVAVYRIRNSSFDYAQANDVDVEYEERGGEAPGRYATLFRKSANSMSGREGSGVIACIGSRSGGVNLESGFHRGEIAVRDANGNEARGSFCFLMRGGSAGAPVPAPAPTARAWIDSVACEFRHELRAEGLYLRMRMTPPLSSAPVVDLLGDTTRSPLGVLPLGRDEYVVLAHPARFRGGAETFRVRGRDENGRAFERFNTFRILALETGSRNSITVGDGLVLSIEAPAVRGVSLMIVRDNLQSADDREGLVLLAAPFALEYAPEGFARYPRCSFSAGRRSGLYRREDRGGWRCVGVPGERSGSVEIRRPGTYAVMADVEAPALRSLATTRKSPPSGFFKRTLYYVSVHEEGSGMDAESIIATLDGRRIVCEWDEHRRRIVLPIPRSHPRGPAQLRIDAADRAGNSNSAEYALVIE